MEQRTETWLEWRNKGIGSSDAPVIMGVSPWKSIYQLWEEKTGRRSNPPTNWAMQRGIRNEPGARAHYELMNDIEMPPALVEHEGHPFLRASLDGRNEDRGLTLEIKCPGQKDHLVAVDGKVPEKYWPQLQHILMITGGELDYFSYYKGQGVTVRVKPDLGYIAKLLIAELEFWKCVTENIPPGGVKEVPNNLAVLIDGWKKAKAEYDKAAELLESFKESIGRAMPLISGQVVTEGVKVAYVERKGSVDYGKVPQLVGVDLEPFRKPPTKYLDIRMVKE